MSDEETPRPIHRTAPLSPTFGPGDGRDWAAYFREMKAPHRDATAAQQVQVPAEEPYPVGEPTHLSAGEIDVLRAPWTVPARIAKRLTAQGWQVRGVMNVAHMPATLRVNATDEHAAGTVLRPSFELVTLTLGAVKRDATGRIGLAMLATWTDKEGFRIAETADPLDGREIRVKYQKARPANRIEVEEGIAPPLGFAQWLDDFAPTAASRKKAAQAAPTKGEWIG